MKNGLLITHLKIYLHIWGHTYSSHIAADTKVVVSVYLFTAIREHYDDFPHLNEVVSRKFIGDIQE